MSHISINVTTSHDSHWPNGKSRIPLIVIAIICKQLIIFAKINPLISTDNCQLQTSYSKLTMIFLVHLNFMVLRIGYAILILWTT